MTKSSITFFYSLQMYLFPGFTRIKAEDQIDLIKGSVVEMMLLRNAHSYNRRRRDVDLSLVAKDTGIVISLWHGLTVPKFN